MKSITFAVASLIGLVSGATPPYGYASKGVEWSDTEEYKNCGLKGGSPIDLKAGVDLNIYVERNYALDKLSF